MNYWVSAESLLRGFPAEFRVPTLLLDFANWLNNKRKGSVGHFGVLSERFNDYWIENGADLHPYFAFFLRDPTGGQFGYWLYDGPTTACPPIVLVGSEGELSILSETLDEFLSRLAKGGTASALDFRDQDAIEGAELTKWLESRITKPPAQNRRNHPDLKQWMEAWGRQQRGFINTDPLHLQIADKLRKFVSPNAKAWQTANFDVLLVGTQFRMWHRSHGPQPMPQNETADLESLFRSVRAERAKKTPERGVWFYSWVRVGSQGGANLCCNFMDEPKVMEERLDVPICDYERDLHDFPRSKHWMPEWIK